MTARTAKAAGEGDSNGEGLLGLPMNAPTQGIVGDRMTRDDRLPPSTDRRACLLIPRSVIESPERPTVVVGERLSRKARMK